MPGFTDTHTIESQPIKKDSQPSNSVISRVENMTHYTLQIERVLWRVLRVDKCLYVCHSKESTGIKYESWTRGTPLHLRCSNDETDEGRS